MIDSEDCCSVRSDSSIVVSENGKKFIFENTDRKQIQVCRVDGCLLGDGIKKCDYLFFIDCKEPQRIILVELKGVDHVKAVEQIVSAAENLDLKSHNVEIHSYVIGSSSPKTTTKLQKALLKLNDRYVKAGVKIPVVKNNQHSVR